jgi:pimeloyl-ACP methyl ester carboxylesterase
MACNLHSVPAEVRAATHLGATAQTYASITAQTLIMVGARSPRWLRQAGQELAAAMPAAQLATAAGLDHNGPLLHPEPVAQQVIQSIAGMPTA